jgi:hypothetical protein
MGMPPWSGMTESVGLVVDCKMRGSVTGVRGDIGIKTGGGCCAVGNSCVAGRAIRERGRQKSGGGTGDVSVQIMD